MPMPTLTGRRNGGASSQWGRNSWNCAGRKGWRMSKPPTRWDAWQASPVATRRLTPEELREGYTVVRVHPQAREAFLDLLPLLTVYSQLASHRTPPEDLPAVWQEWRTWTRQLVAYLRRLHASQPGTLPGLPSTLAALVLE